MKGQAQPYEPLTSKNAALVLVDHQVGLVFAIAHAPRKTANPHDATLKEWAPTTGRSPSRTRTALRSTRGVASWGHHSNVYACCLRSRLL